MIKKIFVLIICAMAFSFNVAQGREIIFVVNCGQSMNSVDPLHEISESIMWSAENLSADDEIGIITFGEVPQVLRPLSKIQEVPLENLQLEYRGQSNISAALLQAVDILSKKFNTDRAIIFFTDGENLLDASGNAMFVENVKAGLRQAQWLGIPVYILSLRADLNPQNYHSYDWAKEIPLNYSDLMTTVRTIFHNDFKTPHLQISLNQDLSFEVPVAAPQSLKLLLLSSNAGTAELENFQPTVNRNFLKVFELTPTSNKFQLRADFPAGTGLTLDAIPKVQGFLQTEITAPIFGENILEVTPLYTKTKTKILGDKFFEGKTVTAQINDKIFVGQIEGGVIRISLNGAGENIFLQKIHFEDLGIIFEGEDTAQLKNLSSEIAWIIAFCAIAVILILSWLIHKKNYSVASAAAIPFDGKLKICATGTENFEPREFNLFRVNTSQISLTEILETCNLEVLPEVAGIVIKPVAQGILLENNSNCTLTKEKILIEQGQSVELSYNESVNISAKLILIYKSLKPE